MKYLALHRSMVTTPPFVNADDDAFGCAARMLSYASGDGLESEVIAGCRAWGDRQWLATCQTTAASVEKAVAAGLAEWRGSDLVLRGFDHNGKAKVDRLRHNGATPPRPGKKRGRPRKANPDEAENQLVFGSNTKTETAENPLSSGSLPFPSEPLGASPDRSSRKRPAAPAGARYSSDFLQVWEAYPRKAAKQKAWESFQQTSPPTEQILSALEWQKASSKWQDVKYVPHLATYIRGRRWEDQPERELPASNGLHRDLRVGAAPPETGHPEGEIALP